MVEPFVVVRQSNCYIYVVMAALMLSARAIFLHATPRTPTRPSSYLHEDAHIHIRVLGLHIATTRVKHDLEQAVELRGEAVHVLLQHWQARVSAGADG